MLSSRVPGKVALTRGFWSSKLKLRPRGLLVSGGFKFGGVGFRVHWFCVCIITSLVSGLTPSSFSITARHARNRRTPI